MQPQDIREEIGRFRILVVGRANAGKTTLLRRICNTADNPEVFDGAGNKIDAAIVKSTVYRGEHDIKKELVFQSNPHFVFHHSCGFEARSEDGFEEMKEFILERASTLKLKERIHAIWYCIPMDECHRAITKAEERFFSECGTSSVPVIVVFTKFDALWDDAYQQLRESGLSRSECRREAPEVAKAIFARANIWNRLCEYRYPPKAHVFLAEMDKDNADCGLLLECTTRALGEEAMQMLLISTQQTNLALCIKYAIEKTLILYIKKARTSTQTTSLWHSKATCIDMQQAISAWFPHTQSMIADRFDTRVVRRMRATRRADFVATAVNLDTANEVANSLEAQSASLPSQQFLLFPSLTQTLQLGIGDTLHFCASPVNNSNLLGLIIILEHFIFLLQEGKQEPENILEVAAAKYKTSQTRTAVEKAVKEVLCQNDGDDEKLGNMVEAIISCNYMSKVSLAGGEM